MKTVLTIAGSDSCGGAGIQADLKTFSALGTYGMSVITAVTAQNTMGVINVREMDVEIVRDQIDCLFDDIMIHAVKIGMVSSVEIIETIGSCLRGRTDTPIVLDPVMVSKSGCHLLRPESTEALSKVLFPLAEVVTPNLFEAEVITGQKINNIDGMEEAAVKIHDLGARNVVVKGGHLAGDAVDVLYDGLHFDYLKGTRFDTPNTHGTGCTFSSAIAAYLAGGFSVPEAVREAKKYISGAIENSFALGHGVGPTHHFYALYRKAGVYNE
ncbi:Hydroxymethylpyrimidine/phosphomethylpyrimidine kinase [Sporotomaculum syntrophicum]|uniref:Hydroxymethylpyrimidine/phosphomethylpyrimidine kinase n=1 Tax=Sporotomaculum syntrophicum TaxID=182264 RepID=A0A9D3AZ48_9FIRM|nr:bifunctional hydroxymethylpyrimidine kinase/phosphomethylpyrimidine kinase [Sporotomaculum syntrophicum]KAF1085514.1 Hydroxymethylpyrimidine/phosphomethylpyrimidine kinase [Sporotomaculum syntrophicum]